MYLRGLRLDEAVANCVAGEFRREVHTEHLGKSGAVALGGLLVDQEALDNLAIVRALCDGCASRFRAA